MHFRLAALSTFALILATGAVQAQVRTLNIDPDARRSSKITEPFRIVPVRLMVYCGDQDPATDANKQFACAISGASPHTVLLDGLGPNGKVVAVWWQPSGPIDQLKDWKYIGVDTNAIGSPPAPSNTFTLSLQGVPGSGSHMWIIVYAVVVGMQ